jgi:hypothetical protein
MVGTAVVVVAAAAVIVGDIEKKGREELGREEG